MEIFRNLSAWQNEREKMRGTIGFVPTMGALHAGHRSLLERAAQENQRSVLSIYINPTQFDNPDDLKMYPVTLESDLKIAKEAGVDAVLLPAYEELYHDSYRFKVVENKLSLELCGAHRPGHFDGVLTVVLKLLNLVRADRAYFGEKDFQQLQLVRDMAQSFFLPTQIIACPTVREADGLAMSSRNQRLSPDARQKAALLPRLLKSTLTTDEIKAQLTQTGFNVDYVEDRGARRFAAAVLDQVRLIDNVER